MFKLVNSKELAEFILNKDYDEEYSFATNFDPKLPLNTEFKDDGNINSWYGIKQTKLFDGIYVAVGNYGGGYDTSMINITETTEYLSDDLEKYIDMMIQEGTTVEGLVCVDLDPKKH